MLVPVAISLVSDIAQVVDVDKSLRLPVRKEVGNKKVALQANDEVYIGRGHHSHRRACTKWASPSNPGQHGSPTDCLVLYADHLHREGLVNHVG